MEKLEQNTRSLKSDKCGAQVEHLTPYVINDIEESNGYSIKEVLSEGMSITDDSLKGTYHLFEGGVADLRGVQARQDSDLAARLSKISAVPLPPNIRPGEFVAVPLDIMAYTDSRTGELRFAFLEFNTLGFGCISCLPEQVLDSFHMTLNEAGKMIGKDSNALVLVACAGRQEPLSPDTPEKLKPNRSIHEKVWLADCVAEGIRSIPGVCKDVSVVSLHDPRAFEQWAAAADSPWRDSNGPTVLVGYTREFVESKGMRVIDGVPYFYGRRVTGMVNDRFISNLQAAHGNLDPTKFLSCNITSRIGTDKHTAYTAANAYNRAEGSAFSRSARPIVAEYGRDKKELVSQIQRFLKEGRRVIIKPNNTGWGHGIETFVDLLEAEEDIISKVERSIADVNTHYNSAKVVAGFPYTVTEYFDANTVNALDENSPYHYAHESKYELRVAVYADYSGDKPVLRACPANVKLQLAKASRVCNVSMQINITSRPCSDFMLPFCNQDTFKLLKLSEESVMDLCKWSSGFVAHVLKARSFNQ